MTVNPDSQPWHLGPEARPRLGLAVSSHSALKIDRLVDVLDKPGLSWLPTQLLPGQRARGLVVDRGEMREPAEMRSRLLWSLADHRHAEPAADDAGDLTERHARLGDRMVAGAATALLQHQPVKPGGIEPVHGGPAVEALAGVDRGTLLTRNADEDRDEAVIASTMDRRRQADDRNARTFLGRGVGSLLRDARDRRVGSRRDVLGRDAARLHKSDARGDDQRPVGAD